MHRLTAREYETVARFAAGQKWERVMREMGISRATVHVHRCNAMAKYNAGHMLELYRRLGWLQSP